MCVQYYFELKVCVSINITSGKSRQSSSATLGSISWIGKPFKNKEPNYLQNLPISPNLDWLPLIPGIVEVLNLLEAEVTPAKAVSMKTWEYLHRIKVLQVLIMQVVRRRNYESEQAKASIYRHIQSRWKTPPRAFADRPGGRSHET